MSEDRVERILTAFARRTAPFLTVRDLAVLTGFGEFEVRSLIHEARRQGLVRATSLSPAGEMIYAPAAATPAHAIAA